MPRSPKKIMEPKGTLQHLEFEHAVQQFPAYEELFLDITRKGFLGTIMIINKNIEGELKESRFTFISELKITLLEYSNLPHVDDITNNPIC